MQKNSIYEYVLSKRQRTVLGLLVFFWLVLVTLFMLWWFEPRHFVTGYGLILNSIIIFWNYFIPGYFFYFISRMSVVRKDTQTPPDWRVAMIVTKVPSEPFEVMQKTVLACLAQKFAHDTWVADENPTEETKKWCEEHGVKISTRFGVAEYHNEKWPSRTKCKEGNLAYFYDKYGYDNYDFVVQLDIDHVPGEDYLEEMIRPFVDEKVGYVSAPSICDANKKESWSARARLYAEGIMHGPLQAGHTNGFAPLCIGSHYAVRTSALKEIGGLGPELAEDHSTTLLFNAGGWRGVHALNAEAHGDGPTTFADCMTQEFQWSRSLQVLLLTLTPEKWPNLPPRLRGQFLFSQLWYPLFTIIMLMGLCLPLLSIILEKPLVSIPYLSFLLASVILDISIFAIVLSLKKWQLLRPKDAHIISWEMVIFQLARWPYVLYGIAMGTLDVIRRKNFAIKITPKGAGERKFPWGILLPYIVLITIYLLVLNFGQYTRDTAGYYYFSYLIVLYYFISIFVIVFRHKLENKIL